VVEAVGQELPARGMNLVSQSWRCVVGITSIARTRGRALVVVTAVAMTAALAASPVASGAVNGDPIASSVFKVKLSSAFKKQLRQNGVSMKPKKLKLGKGQSDVVPTTGKADLRLGKITFKKGGKKVVYGNVKGSLPGILKGTNGKLFRLTKAKVARNGFGANLYGIEVKFLGAAAKKINKKLGLHSLHAASLGKMTLNYQPATVQILGGTASTTGASRPSPAFAEAGPYPVSVKLGFGHCVNGSSNGTAGFPGIQPIAPATQPGGPGTTIFLPIIGGTISPTADAGNVQQSGGVKLIKNLTINGGGSFGDCTNGGAGPYPGELNQTDQVVRLGEKDVQAQVNVAAAPPGFAPTGNIGTVIGQTLDTTGTVVTADPATRTISTTGTLVKVTETSATSLNGIFPCVNTTPCSDATNPSTAVLKGGDLFGGSTLTVVTR
jgi:hypothetical protein